MKDSNFVWLVVAFACAVVAGVIGVIAKNVTLVLLAVAGAILAAVVLNWL